MQFELNVKSVQMFWLGVTITVTSSLGLGFWGTYARSAAKAIKQVVRDRVPASFLAAELQEQVRRLSPEIEDQMKKLARMEEEDERLVGEIEAKQLKLDEATADLRILGREIGRSITSRRADLAGQGLAARLAACEADRAHLDALRRMRETRRAIMAEAERQVDWLRSQYDLLSKRVQSLGDEARWAEGMPLHGEALNVAPLAEARELADRLEGRIRTIERRNELEIGRELDARPGKSLPEVRPSAEGDPDGESAAGPSPARPSPQSPGVLRGPRAFPGR